MHVHVCRCMHVCQVLAYMYACIHDCIHASLHAQKKMLDLSPTCSQHMHTQNQIANLDVITYAQTIGSRVHFRTRAGKSTRTSKLLSHVHNVMQLGNTCDEET
jgi:hypothetical protein